MYRVTSQIIKRLLLLYVCLIQSGCTGVYYLATKDLEKEYESKTKIKAANISQGTEIRLELRDKRLFEGKFRGIVDFTSDEYLERYKNFLAIESDLQPLPFPRDTITVIKYPEKEYTGNFQGFDHGYTGKICIRQFPDGVSRKLRLDDVKEIHFNGNSMSGTALRTVLSRDIIPHLSTVKIESGGVQRQFGMAAVRDISVLKGVGMRRYLLFYAILSDLASFGLVSGIIDPEVSFKRK